MQRSHIFHPISQPCQNLALHFRAQSEILVCVKIEVTNAQP